MFDDRKISGECRSCRPSHDLEVEAILKMKFMLLVYLDEKEWAALSPEEQQAQMASCQPHVAALTASGKMLGGAPLQPTTTAVTVGARNGKRLVIDGPFAETKEQLGGYALIEADDREDAIRIAQGFVGDQSLSRIEVRPLVELPPQ